MSECKDSCDCRRIKLPREDGEAGATKPGDFAWDTDLPGATAEEKAAPHRTLYLHVPGAGHWSAWPVHRGGTDGPRVWGWDGNEDKPTLAPSLWHQGVWHGHLLAGYLKSVP